MPLSGRQRSALWEATHTGGFASVYWAVWGVAIGLGIAAFAWGSPENQRVTGFVVFAVVVVQIVAGALRARRIERRRRAAGAATSAEAAGSTGASRPAGSTGASAPPE